MVFKFVEDQEFRRGSRVPVFIESSDASHCYCNLVTVVAVYVIPDVSGIAMAIKRLVFQGGL